MALIIQHAMHILHIILSSVASLALTVFFPIISHNTARFSEKNTIERAMCNLFFSTIFFLNISLIRNTEREINTNVHWPLCKVPVITFKF